MTVTPAGEKKADAAKEAGVERREGGKGERSKMERGRRERGQPDREPRFSSPRSSSSLVSADVSALGFRRRRRELRTCRRRVAGCRPICRRGRRIARRARGTSRRPRRPDSRQPSDAPMWGHRSSIAKYWPSLKKHGNESLADLERLALAFRNRADFGDGDEV